MPRLTEGHEDDACLCTLQRHQQVCGVHAAGVELADRDARRARVEQRASRLREHSHEGGGGILTPRAVVVEHRHALPVELLRQPVRSFDHACLWARQPR